MLINQRILVDVIFLHHFGQFPTMYTSHISMVQVTNACQQSSNWIGQINFTLYVHRYLQCNKDLYLGVGASRSVQLCEQEKITDIKLMFYLRFYTTRVWWWWEQKAELLQRLLKTPNVNQMIFKVAAHSFQVPMPNSP